ncbi:ABC transporter ATP-binding protein [Streptosporangium lutulentum]|uniref:ABC transporter ATP-binding protein n=1 Tax=Streptosporangium lutulentum TaxID=1461250 RepID=UPI0027D8CB43|nr:ATP-binding cassette domain-containing protein [Streptosporangium lutulentum]
MIAPSGTVHVLGKQLGRVELQALRRSIGHVNPRHPLRSPLTIREVILTGITGSIETPLRWHPQPSDLAQADSLIDTLGLAGKADEKWPTLSQGERGRVLIARALICNPRLLLLDEPSTGLDVAAREQLLETIDLLDSTHPDIASILVTHHLEELPTTTTHALLITDGRVVTSGAVRAAVTTENVSAAFNHPINVQHQDGRWTAKARRHGPSGVGSGYVNWPLKDASRPPSGPDPKTCASGPRVASTGVV